MYLVQWNYLEPQNTLLNVAKDVHLNNRTETTHYAQNYLLNCFIVCYCIILSKFSQQNLRAALHFRSRKYGSRPLFK